MEGDGRGKGGKGVGIPPPPSTFLARLLTSRRGKSMLSAEVNRAKEKRYLCSGIPTDPTFLPRPFESNFTMIYYKHDILV